MDLIFASRVVALLKNGYWNRFPPGNLALSLKKQVARPPSSRPSPQGEGESHAVPLKNLRLDLPDGDPKTIEEQRLFLLLGGEG